MNVAETSPRDALAGTRRLVVKLGTAVVTQPEGGLALGRLGMLIEEVGALRARGVEVILVTSGAVGLGRGRIRRERLAKEGLPKLRTAHTERPQTTLDKQVAAAVGQGALMAFYDGLLRQVGLIGAQVLLTEEDFYHRPRFVSLSATLERLLEIGALPIVNENDTVATAELREDEQRVFGDNDRLSALVAAGLGADALLILSNVDGVHTGPPGSLGSDRISAFVSGQEDALQFGKPSAQGRGGMQSKVASALVAANCGVHVVVASGLTAGVIGSSLAGEDVGTFFPAREGLSRKQGWLAYATLPAGNLVVNAGAARALMERGASLLLPGLVSVNGRFSPGEVVSVFTEAGAEIARGISEFASQDLIQRMHEQTPASPSQEGATSRIAPVLHRDRIVLLPLDEGPI